MLESSGSRELSMEEICFVLVIESHYLACEALDGFVKEAMRKPHPDNWIEKMCCCFSRGVRQKLKLDLDRNQPVRDFFVLCKVIRSCLRDITRSVPTSIGRDFIQRQVLSMNVHSVEEGRHFLFHGDQLSLDETGRCLALVGSILSILLGACNPWIKKNRKVMDVCKRLKEQEQVCFLVSQLTMNKFLLQRSFNELAQKLPGFQPGFDPVENQ